VRRAGLEPLRCYSLAPQDGITLALHRKIPKYSGFRMSLEPPRAAHWGARGTRCEPQSLDSNARVRLVAAKSWFRIQRTSHARCGEHSRARSSVSKRRRCSRPHQFCRRDDVHSCCARDDRHCCFEAGALKRVDANGFSLHRHEILVETSVFAAFGVALARRRLRQWRVIQAGIKPTITLTSPSQGG